MKAITITPARVYIFFVVSILVPLTLRPFWIPDESRYAEIAREILETGNWVVPQLLGLNYFEKPMGGHWLNAFSQMLFGENVFAGRFSVALSILLSAVLVGFLTKKIWQDAYKTGIAVLIYLSSLLVSAMALHITLDPPFSLLVNLALISIFLATKTEQKKVKVFYWVLVGVSCGGAFLIKGFLGLLLPTLVGSSYLLWYRTFKELFYYGSLATGVSVLVLAPWSILVHLQASDYWHFFFWNEHVRRFISEDAQHSAPFWYYFPVISLGFIPWMGILIPSLKNAWNQRSDLSINYLGLWLVIPFVFLSITKGKLPTYILTCFTPLSIFAAHWLVESLKKQETKWLRINGVVNLIVGGSLFLTVVYLKMTGVYKEVDSAAWIVALLLSSVWILAALMQLRTPNQFFALPAFVLLAGLVCLPFISTKTQITLKSPSEFIQEIKPYINSSTLVLSNGAGLAPTLAWELQRSDIFIYSSRGELKYGLETQLGEKRYIPREKIRTWIDERQKYSDVALVLRVTDSEDLDLLALPKGEDKFILNEKLAFVHFPKKN